MTSNSTNNNSSYSTQKVIVITGANKGLGFHAVKLLTTNKSNHVILICRNFNRIPIAFDPQNNPNARKNADNYETEVNCKQTRIQLLHKKFADIKNIDFVEMDIADKKSVEQAFLYIKQKYKTIDVLVNNAAMAFKGNSFDTNVVETTLATNYYGTMHVTQTFLPILKNGGRLIFVSSRAGKLSSTIKDSNLQSTILSSNFNLENIESVLQQFRSNVEQDSTLANSVFKRSAYGMSKMALNAYFRHLCRELNTDENMNKIFIGAYCPGWCVTSMTSGSGNRLAIHGAKGIQLLCEVDECSADVNGKFWGVEYQSASSKERIDVNTAVLVNYNWTNGQIISNKKGKK